MKNKKGISLIVLIITIIIVIILAAVVIITMSKNNPINSAREARFKEDIRNFQNELSMYIGNQIVKDYSGTREKITTTDSSTFDEMKEYILSFQEKYEGKLGIEKDELVYFPKKVTEEEEKWLIDLGIKSKSLKETAESEFEWGSEDPDNSEYGTITNYVGKSRNIIIPERCKKIKNRTFYCKSFIESIIITKNVSSISNDFVSSECDKLTCIDVVEDNNYFSSQDGVLFNKNKTRLIRYPEGGLIKEYTIPDTITCIDTYSFYSCDNIEKIIIPNSVLKIEQNAIYSCNKLKSITISDNIKDVGIENTDGSNFSHCDSLTDITVSPNNKYYSSDNGILFNKNKDKIIKYPCGKEDKVYTIPDSVTSIEYNAFESCQKLESVIMPDSVSTIRHKAFNQCSNLKSVSLSKNLTYIDSKTFTYCNNLSEIILPEGIKSVGMEAFKYCKNLKNVTFPSTLTSIATYAFYGCSNLTNLKFPEILNSIGDSAFSGCINLNEIIIPINVNKMGKVVFSGCTNLVINCEISEKPDGWNSNWHSQNSNDNITVNWGYTKSE